MKRRKYEIGQYYRLLEDIGPIPQGVYRLEDVSLNWASFSVGKKRQIHFSIIFKDDNQLQRLSLKQGKAERTSEKSFAIRYYDLMENPVELHDDRDTEKLKPITYAIVSPEVEAKYRPGFTARLENLLINDLFESTQVQ